MSNKPTPKHEAAVAVDKAKSPSQHQADAWRNVAKHARSGETGRALRALAHAANLQADALAPPTPAAAPATPAAARSETPIRS